MEAKDRIIFAADVGSLDELKGYLAAFGNKIGAIKLGMELLTHALLTGEPIIKYVLEETKFRIMWDLKYGDIPATVAGAAKEVAKYGQGRILGFTVHCTAGKKALEQAVQAVKDNFGEGPDAPMVIGITLLTSLDQSDLDQMKIQGSPKDVVLRLAGIAAEAKLPAIVCSPQETAEALKIGNFIAINPGIRFQGSDLGSQKRVTTPEDAIRNGAAYIVMGSDLRKGDPAANAQRAITEIELGLSGRNQPTIRTKVEFKELFTLTKDRLINLDPKDVPLFIPDEAIVHFAKTLDAYWRYDYEAARNGKPGHHAILKSKNHSDGFFVSKILLQYPNILEIIAFQMVYRYRYFQYPMPEWVAGIPDGATKLGEKVAEMLGARVAEMAKVGGKITMVTNIPPFSTLLFVEDFCTKGTGFIEAVTETKKEQPFVRVLPYELVILNRGRMSGIIVPDVGPFIIQPAAYYPVDDWSPDECPLCKEGSIPIKPKESDENWITITTSQL